MQKLHVLQIRPARTHKLWHCPHLAKGQLIPTVWPFSTKCSRFIGGTDKIGSSPSSDFLDLILAMLTCAVDLALHKPCALSTHIPTREACTYL